MPQIRRNGINGFRRFSTPDQTVGFSLFGRVRHLGREDSIEVFVNVIKEGLLRGERKIAATSFLTFVALDEDKKPVSVPEIVPETEEEKKLHETLRSERKSVGSDAGKAKKLQDFYR